MPKQPSFIQKVNFIRRWFSIKCETPWIVYFETALPATGNLILSLVLFGLDDVVRGFFKPKNLRSGRHGRKKKPRSARKGAIPEIGEIVGQNIPGHEVAANRKVQRGVKNLWIIDAQIQKALYHWLIVDVVASFAYDWLSGILKDPASKCNVLARAYRKGLQRPLLGTGGSFHGFTNQELVYANGVIEANPSGCVIGPGSAIAIVSATVKNDQASVRHMKLLCRFVQTGSLEATNNLDEITVVPGQESDIMASLDCQGPGVISFLVMLDGSILCTESEYVVTSVDPA